MPAGRRSSGVLATLLALAVLYTAYFTAPISMPIAAAGLLYFLLSPPVERLVRLGVPRPLASVAVVALLVSILVGVLYPLADPAADWLREVPTSVRELREKFRDAPNPLADVREASKAVEDAVKDITNGDSAPRQETPSVRVDDPTLLDKVLGRVPMALGSAVVAVVLTLFLLVSGDRLLRKLTSIGSTFTMRRRVVHIVRQIEHDIARYLGTVAIINCGLGILVAAAMYLAGLPNPLLWGAVAGILNFAPYLGPALTTAVILVASATTFNEIGEILVPPALFFCMTALEGQVVTPFLLGHRLELSPVVVLLSVIVFGWIWGLVGALLAVPIVASIRIVLINVPAWRPIGMLLAK
jgi:predicted PurR-regulated permease PerM